MSETISTDEGDLASVVVLVRQTINTGIPHLLIELQSQRDLSLQVPINFVTTPGVSLSAACFSELQYDDDAAKKCFTNLFDVDFQRFELDLYWDEGRSIWSFCPVQLESSGSGQSQDATESTMSSSISFSSATVTDISPSSESQQVTARQASESSNRESSSTVFFSSSSLTTSLSPSNSTTLVSLETPACYPIHE